LTREKGDDGYRSDSKTNNAPRQSLKKKNLLIKNEKPEEKDCEK